MGHITPGNHAVNTPHHFSITDALQDDALYQLSLSKGFRLPRFYLDRAKLAKRLVWFQATRGVRRGCSERSISRALSCLVGLGVLAREGQDNPGPGVYGGMVVTVGRHGWAKLKAKMREIIGRKQPGKGVPTRGTNPAYLNSTLYKERDKDERKRKKPPDKTMFGGITRLSALPRAELERMVNGFKP